MSQEKKDNKRVIFGEEARNSVLKGAKEMAQAVGMSYGPKGRNVLIEKSYGRPIITRDGVTISKEVYSEVRDENMGMQLLNEAAETTVRNVGDGTTQTVLLTYELLQLGMNKVASGVNPMEVKQEILEDSYKVLDNLETMRKDIKKGQLKQVASVSSGDEALGQLIAEAVETVGPDGGLITEKAPITDVDRTYVNGYYMQQGFTAINSGKKELENPYIVISNKIISSKVDAMELITKIAETAHKDQGINDVTKPLTEPLRIAFFGEIEGDAYNIFVANITQGVFDGTITKTPPMGDMGVQYLEDLAVYCGGKAIASGESLSKIDESYIGMADKVTCTNVDTTIFGGQAVEEDLNQRKADLKDRIAKEEIDALSEKLKDRLAKLENKIAVFRIGGATDTEREEREFRIEDSIQASRAAASSGVVTGGGMTLLKLSQTKGINDIFVNALQNVFKRLMENAALAPDVKLNEALNAPEGHGFNLRENAELVNLVSSGILDPYLVVKEVVKNASATAANAVSLGAVITFTNKDD